jgi:hypothetical protein
MFTIRIIHSSKFQQVIIVYRVVNKSVVIFKRVEGVARQKGVDVEKNMMKVGGVNNEAPRDQQQARQPVLIQKVGFHRRFQKYQFNGNCVLFAFREPTF